MISPEIIAILIFFSSLVFLVVKTFTMGKINDV